MQKIFFLIALVFSLTSNSAVLLANPYKGAEYRTKDSFLYGRFEVRYKPANRDGVVSSFFTYHEITDSTGWNEIDFEFIGRYPNLIQFNTITPGQRFHIRSNLIDYDPYLEFHDYAFEWTPYYVAWFIDGLEVYRQTGEHISTLIYPQKIMMNIWNPVYTNWVGYFQDVGLPTSSVYDFVSYSSYTPGEGNYGTNNDFTFEWKDEFNSFDTEKWEKATHTFPGNQADFIEENAVFKDGKLYLYLTIPEDLAGIDNTSPQILWAMANYDSTISVKFSEEITKESAEATSNFLLPVISKIELSENNLFATLHSENYNPYNPVNLIYSGFVDLSSNQNTTPTKVVLVNNVDSVKFPIKINVAGDAINDYSADQEWSSAVQYGYLMGDSYSYSSSIDIQGTDEDEVYLSDRRGIISYKFKVPNGIYNLSLLFSDNTNKANGDAVFSLFAEGKYLKKNLDLISEVGQYTKYQHDAEVEVLDGVLDIFFEEEIDSAFVNGIIIDQLSTNIGDNNLQGYSESFKLNQNYPNPFNPMTKISYQVESRGNILLEVFDVVGNKLETLVNETKNPGIYEFDFDASLISSGIYFYRLMVNGNNIATRKMAVLK